MSLQTDYTYRYREDHVITITITKLRISHGTRGKHNVHLMR